MTAGEEIRDAGIAAADAAVAHDLVEGAIGELLDNLNLPDAGLPSYGIRKVAHYSAQVARAQALGIDPSDWPAAEDPGVPLLLARLAAARASSIRDLLETIAETLNETLDGIRTIAERNDVGVRSCTVCGCTDDRACLGGCSWTDVEGVCSTCVKTVLAEVQLERGRQNEKWGEQNHPDGTGPTSTPLTDFYLTGVAAAKVAAAAKFSTDAAARAGEVTWRHILIEEVLEAFAEADPDALRAELIQVAAVSTQWVEAIDRRAVAS